MKPLSWHEREFAALFSARAVLPHALLLHGPRGIGKLAFARALAQALLCEAPETEGACGRCTGCTWFEADGHPDYRQVEPDAAGADDDGDGEADDERPASKKKKSTVIKVDQIRATTDYINISSHRGGPKVIVVHPAEALHVSAANALLKSLEEPPPRTHFLLVSHRPHQLLPTIRSRCRQVALHAPDEKAATAWLAAHGMRDPGLALAHMGAPLLALELNGAEYWGARAAFMRQITARDIDVLAAADAIGDCPIPDVIAWLQKWSYDLVHFRATGRVRYNPDQQDAIARVAAAADPLAMLRFHREMVQLQLVAQHPLNPRLFVEQLLLDYRNVVEPEARAA